jgi:outer membrane protein assembly factor BamE (lipoprotein component of BamABCDE complex)
MTSKSRRFLPVLFALAVLAGCAQYDNSRGVEVTWQTATLSDLRRGETTRAQVLDRLGPPSQVIALGDETVLYYLNEQADGRGLLLVVYNRFDVETRYDRAIFFFDENDTLTDYSTWIRPAGD